MSVGYKVVAVDETNHPQARVNIYAVSLNNYPNVSAIVEANEAGEAVFTGLDGPHFFWAQEIRTSTTVGDRTYSGKLHVQVVSLNNAPCYDFVVDPNGMGTHTTIQSALDAAGALPANASTAIFICPGTYDEELNTTSVINASLILQGAGQDSVRVQPVSIAGSKTGPVLDIATQSGGRNAVVIDGIAFDATFLSATNPVCLNGGGSTRIKLSRCGLVGGVGSRGIAPGGGLGIGWEVDQVNFQTRTGVHAVNSAGGVQITNSSFEPAAVDVGIFWSNSIFLSVSNTVFSCTSGIGVHLLGPSQLISITNCIFQGENTGIKFATSLASAPTQVTIIGNVFYSHSIGIDYSTITTPTEAHTITGNTFKRVASVDIGIKCHPTLLKNSIISSNTFGPNYTAGNEINGITATQASAANLQIAHNVTSNATPILDAGGAGHGPSVTYISFGGDPVNGVLIG